MKIVVLLLCFSFTFAQTTAPEVDDIYTADEVLAYFSANNDKKRTLSVVVEPTRADTYITFRTLFDRVFLNRDYWRIREQRIADRIHFEKPIFVLSLTRFNDEALVEAMPIIESSSAERAQRGVIEYKSEKEFYSTSSEINPIFKQERLDEIEQRYASGNYQVLYERYVQDGKSFYEGVLEGYYLLPIFYKGEMQGYNKIHAKKHLNFTSAGGGVYRQPWSYPLRVTSEEAQEIAGLDIEPVLVDTYRVLHRNTAEQLFWLMDTKLVGAMTGALYEVATEKNEVVDPWTVQAISYTKGVWFGGSPWFTLVLPVKLIPIKSAVYEWDSSLKTIVPNNDAWVTNLLIALTWVFAILGMILSAWEKRKRKNAS